MSISLKKGERISLTKNTGIPGLSKIFMGLGWDPVPVKTGFFGKTTTRNVDLDASVIVFDEQGNVIDTVSFLHLQTSDGSIKHSGDNQTGRGAGDDERIYVDLPVLSPRAKALVFTVNSFRGQNFSIIEKATCRLVDQVTGKELASLVLTDLGEHTAAIMVSVYRNKDEWKLATIAEVSQGRTVEELIDIARKHI
jgi:tellurium resistance protein TerZ